MSLPASHQVRRHPLGQVRVLMQFLVPAQVHLPLQGPAAPMVRVHPRRLVRRQATNLVTPPVQVPATPQGPLVRIPHQGTVPVPLQIEVQAIHQATV